MYDRHLKPPPVPPYTGLTYRIKTLIGITGAKMAKYRTPLYECVMSPLRVAWRPHLLMALVFEAMLFGFSIGINASIRSSLLNNIIIYLLLF